MLNNIILFVTAVLGFLCTALIFGKNKYQKYSLINKYLIIIIALQSLRLLVYAICLTYPNMNIIWLRNIMDVLIVALMPCFFLYFQNIVFENKFKVVNLTHFIAPTLFIAIFCIKTFVSPENELNFRKMFFFVGMLFYVIYCYLTFRMLYTSVWLRKSEIKAIQKQNELIKNWSIFLYVCFNAIMVFRIFINLVVQEPFKFNFQFLSITALIWDCIFIKILLTPEILYGYNFLNKTIDAVTEKLALSSVWNFEGTVLPVTSEKDKKLKKKMKPLLLEYLHQMEEYSFHTHAFRNPDLTPDHIAVALKIPISHINFILKFHCNESFTDYKKIVRIHDATKLLERGYLNDHKVESLASLVGFSSYNTFSIAFKNITGMTAQDYVKRF